MKNLILRLSSKMPVILDGATATELQRLGRSISAPLWSSEALLSSEGQKEIINIHKSYIEAGADIVTTNTFRTNKKSVIERGLDISPQCLVKTAVSLAKSAIEESAIPDRKIYIAGSLAPIGDAYKPMLAPDSEVMEIEHSDSIDDLYKAGVDFILAETMNNWREVKIIGRLCKEKNIPFVVSFACDDKGFLLSGENYSCLQDFVEEYKPITVSVNCTSLPNTLQAIERLSVLTDTPLGAYPNVEDRPDAFSCDHRNTYIKPKISTRQFSEFMEECSNRYDLGLIGGCCGTTPNYIRMLRELVDTGAI
jgi:S-methylmethionine-dependent homocysteine/selenocysteine methylase